jgi:hypothetical protein
VGEGEPDRRADGDVLHAQERRAQLGEQPLGDRERVKGAVDVLAQDGELVASDARSGVLRAQDGRDAPGDRHEQLVAGGVAEPVVDVLEAVEVAEQDRDAVAVAADARRRLPEAILEQRAVREAGELVVQRLMRERAL